MDSLINAQKRSEFWKAESMAATKEIERLRIALEECDHQTHSLRVWANNEWKYSPPRVGQIARISREALDYATKGLMSRDPD